MCVGARACACLCTQVICLPLWPVQLECEHVRGLMLVAPFRCSRWASLTRIRRAARGKPRSAAATSRYRAGMLRDIEQLGVCDFKREHLESDISSAECLHVYKSCLGGFFDNAKGGRGLKRQRGLNLWFPVKNFSYIWCI